MEVKQISGLLNDVFKEVTGQLIPQQLPQQPQEGEQAAEPAPVAVISEDLSDIVTVGQKVLSSTWKDNYVHSIIDRIGREVYVNRVYEGYAPKVLRDAWEYGSIMAKYRCKVFAAKDNPAWQLEAGEAVEQFEFVPPEVSQKFYNDKTSWQIECSFTDVQLQESFTSPAAMNRFISMIETRIQTSKTIYIDSLVMRTINNFIAEKLSAGNGVVDILPAYNETQSTPITAAQAMRDKEFWRFFALTVALYVDRFKAPSVNFNMGDDEPGDNVTFTPQTFAHLVLHTDVAKAMEVYLQSDTYHDNLVKLGDYETVPFWQLQGTQYKFDDTSRINVKLASDNTKVVDRNYIAGVLFDYDALGVLCENQRVKSSYNSNGEYYTNFYKTDSEHFNDLAENGIVFVIGDGIPNVTTEPMAPDATIWEYEVSDLQSNVVVDNVKMTISGTLKYISSGALPPTWGNGNFIALQWLDLPADATSVMVGIDNLVDIVPDPDRNGTIKVSDTTKKLSVISTTPHGVNTQLYDLSGLTLEPQPQAEEPEDTKKATPKK